MPMASGATEQSVIDSQFWWQFMWEKLQEASGTPHRPPCSDTVWFKNTTVYLSIYKACKLKGLKTKREPKEEKAVNALQW